MSGLAVNTRRWFSLAMIVMMLATAVLPYGWTSNASAAAVEPEEIAGWSFTSATSLTATGGNAANRGISALSVSGNRTLSYTSSTKTLYTNGWVPEGEYWQVKVNSQGYTGLTLSSKHYGSGTSPKDFKIQFSLDGSQFQDVAGGAYQVTSTTALQPGPDRLALPADADNRAELYIRWVSTGSVSVSGGAAAAGGNSRIAEISIMGLPLAGPSTGAVTAKPAPNAWPLGTAVELSSPTAGATVYADVYTGGTGTGYTPHTAPITLNGPVTVKAYASAPGYKDSEVASFDYSILAKTDIAASRMLEKQRNVWTEGIVTHIDGQEMYIQDDTGGIVLYGYPAFAAVGDRVSVGGVMEVYRNLQELKPQQGLTYEVVTPRAGVPAAKRLTADDLSEANGEQHEAELVYLEQVTVTGKNGNAVTASQGGKSFTIYSGLSRLSVGKTFAKITGVVKQFDAVYQLIPLGDYALVENLLSVTASPAAGRIVKGGSVTLSSPTEGAAIHYTVDGTEPTAASPLYTGPITVAENLTIKAVAVAEGQTSEVFSFAYQATDKPRIRDIQGEGHTSEYAGQAVTDIEGIVTQYGYTFATGAYKGFYMQDPSPDQKPGTSEGIFVFSTNESAKPGIGDLVKVNGTVVEYNENSGSNLTSTQITNPAVTVVSSHHPLPEPVVLGKGGRVIPSSVIDNDAMAKYEPDEDAIDFYESLEGMRVKLQAPTILSPYWVSGTGDNAVHNLATRVDNGADEVLTPAGGLVLKEQGNLNPQRLLIAYGNPGREVGTGDTFAEDVTGVIGYNFGNYKVIPPLGGLPATVNSSFRQETTTLAAAEDKLTIGSYNVENFHPGVGADKINKIAASIVNNLKTPDILGLVEMQDNSGETDNGIVDADQSYTALVEAVKAAGGPAYAYTDISPVNNQDGGAPGGNIRVGFLYNQERVKLSGSVNGRKGSSTEAVGYSAAADQLTYNPGRIDPSNSAFASPSKSRKPLAAQFEFKGEKVIVIANHFNSKNGDNGPFGSAQPPVLSSEAQRHKIAEVVNGFVKEVLAANPKANIVALGDLNDFQFTGTVTKLKGSELDNLIDKLPLNERYTYTYDGNSQVLDHILVSRNLTAAAQVDIVHLNADFPASRGRVSDHDAVLAQLDFSRKTRLTVLHTNDTHASLDTANSPNNILRRLTAIKEAKAGASNPLLVDAGDVFSGTLYFNKYEGQADLEFMNMAGYDAMTFGNHEFDKGSEVLETFIRNARFPFVSSNVNFSADTVLNPKFKDEIGSPAAEGMIYPAIVKEADGEKIGIIGLTTEDTANISSPGAVTFGDASERAKAAVARLQAQGINKIIALSHLGYEEDVKLAQEVEGLDIIVGGHTHTKLDQPVVDRTHSEPKLIVQAGEKGLYLGKLEVAFDASGVLTEWNGKLISIDEKANGAYVLAEDAAAKPVLETKYKPEIEALKQLVVGQSEVVLNGVRADVRTKETNLGNLIADGMLKAAQGAGTGAVMALQNGGGIRESIDAGPVTQGEVLTVLPFNNDLVTITLTGQEIKEALENGVSKLPSADGRFPHVAGMKFTYDSSKPANARVQSILVKKGNAYVPVEMAESYVVATNAFTAKGGDFYASMEKAYKEGRVNLLYLPDYEVFTNHLKSVGTVTASTSPVEGRIVDVKGSGEPNGNIKLQLLSVNDLHGKINDKYNELSLKMDLNGDGEISDKVYVGGMDYMAAAMKRRQAESPNTLIVHVGDMVGGSPPISALFQDEPVVEIMESIGFDVGVVGNHEFDEGTQELLRLYHGGEHPKGTKGYDGQNFPLLAANVVYKNNGEHVLPPYAVKDVEGVKVGFIGVVTEETPQIVVPAGIQDIAFTDPAEAVNQAVAELKAQGVKAMIVLAHIPAVDEGDLASGEAAELALKVDDEIDVIFAGHNHHRVVGVVDGKLIVQAWEYGKAFGDVDLELDRTTGDIVSKKAELVYNLQTESDPAVRSIIDKYAAEAAPLLNRVVGNAAVEMKKDYPGMGLGIYGDRALGNLIADGMKAAMNADFALMNGGGVRENLDAGDITWGELFSVQPFNNVLVKLEVTGADLEAILNAQLGSGSPYGPDFHVSGFKYTWYRNAADRRKVLDLLLPNGEPVRKDQTYTVVVNNFMHTSTSEKNAEIGKRGKNPVTGPEDLEATVSFVGSFGAPVSYAAEGRIREVEAPVADTTPPVWPEGKSLTATYVSTDNVTLTWSPASDNIGVVSYAVYKDFSPAVTVSGSVYKVSISGLTSDSRYTFRVEAIDAAGNVSVNGPTLSLYTDSESSGSSGQSGTGNTSPSSPGNGQTPGTPSTPVGSASGVELKVDPKDLKKETGPDGKTTTVLTVNAESLVQALEKLGSTAQGKTILLDLGTTVDGAKVSLPVSALKQAAAKAGEAVLTIKAGDASYDLPLGLLKADELAASLGAQASDVMVTLAIEEIGGSLAGRLNDAVSKAGGELLSDAIGFTVTAEAGGKKSEVNGFGRTYVTRTITLSKPVDGSKATAVVFDPASGELSFVPAVFETSGGKTTVRIKRNSNSIYAVVKAEKSFADLSGHWSRADVERLASKLVVKGQTDTSFAPDAVISRAEFAALLVRSLGLKEDASGAAGIPDVQAGAWYAGSLGAAVKAGLMNGFADGTFRPGATITREEMAVMVARAVSAAGKAKHEAKLDAAAHFADGGSIQAWALDDVGYSVKAGIIEGKPGNRFEPAQPATRAEAAVMLKRFLQHAGFMN